MEGLLIFDQSNDLIFFKHNALMKIKIFELAIEQNLVSSNSEEIEYLNPNIIIQIFTPMVASQRIMLSQFDNTYSFLQCHNNLNISFEDVFGYLLIVIGIEDILEQRRYLGVCSGFLQHICGPDVSSLKTSPSNAEMLNKLLDTWNVLYASDQAICTESVEYMLINKEINHFAKAALQSAIKNLNKDEHTQRAHAVLFVQNKFLAQASNKQSQELSSSDMLFLLILSRSLYPEFKQKSITTYMLFLKGGITDPYAGCMPHIAHFCQLDDGIILIMLIEFSNFAVSSSLHDCFFALHKANCVRLQNDIESLRIAFDSLDSCVKNALDALKRAKLNGTQMNAFGKYFAQSWDSLRRKYIEFFKNNDRNLVASVDSSVPAFKDALKDVFRFAFMDFGSKIDTERVFKIAEKVEANLLEFWKPSKAKTLKSFSIESYLDEFPGLVHFIHIDRSNGRMTAPHLNSLSSVTVNKIPNGKIWDMIDFSRSHLQKGVMSVMWKDSAFNYSYFFWFEDSNGAPLKAKEVLSVKSNLTSTRTTASKVQNQHPGVIAGDYYQLLIDECFPKSTGKIKCIELYCVHLGLASVSCVLEHNRRIAATISEVDGYSANAFDFI